RSLSQPVARCLMTAVALKCAPWLNSTSTEPVTDDRNPAQSGQDQPGCGDADAQPLGKRAERVGQLVEHYFRHESANLIAQLCRRFGLGRLQAAEDAVQAAMVQAMLRWPSHGPPEKPAAWLHQVARRQLIDQLRHEQVVEDKRHLLIDVDEQDELDDDWQLHARLPDNVLRMMFVCCHPALDRRDQLALILKILCGFSVSEVAAGLLMQDEAVKKRLQRSRQRLKQLGIELTLPPDEDLPVRIDAIHHALYLMFNEGYSASSGEAPVREDVCEEATRLCHLLACHPLATPATCALLALMLSHAARIQSRTDDVGATHLLADQDRSQWDKGLIEQARKWLQHAGLPSSRYHLEATIALLHCQAEHIDDTDWKTIAALYAQLLGFNDSPLYRLNHAIAVCEAGDPAAALAHVEALADEPAFANYHLLASAKGRVLERLNQPVAACAAYRDAMALARAPHARTVLQRHIDRLSH
ncbi:MAG: sigma-70 family RNA polymerase sigma factor, partial [Pseudomonadota bacterium]